MIRCIIVEDELMSRKLLSNFCNKASIDLVASCKNVEEALHVMEKEAIDLLFLDIEMPGATGFDLLEKCSVMPYVIITTSKEEYAYQAFQYEVSDYLKKPISYPRFLRAIEKVQAQQKPLSNENEKDNIFVKVDGRLVNLKLDDIYFVDNVGDYVRFHTEKKKFIVYSTLKKLEEKLPSNKFMKVHRSYIVNLDKIVDIEENSILIHKEVIPISRSNKATLMSRLNMI